MIPAQELMIGNWVKNKGEEATICKIMRNTAHVKAGDFYHTYLFEYLHPIPITPEWLKRLGFTEDNIGGHYIEIPALWSQFKSLTIAFNNDRENERYYAFFRQGLKDDDRINDTIVCLMRNMNYVHQLQNLYFALTGQQLNVIK